MTIALTILILLMGAALIYVTLNHDHHITQLYWKISQLELDYAEAQRRAAVLQEDFIELQQRVRHVEQRAATAAYDWGLERSGRG